MFIKINWVIVFFCAFFSLSCSSSVLDEQKTIFGIVLSETKISSFIEKYSIDSGDHSSFYPNKVGCLSFKYDGDSIYINFTSSWFFPERIGGYTVSGVSSDIKCTSVSGLSHSPILLKSSLEQLINILGNNYDVGVHSTALSKKLGIYGKKYIKFETEIITKTVKVKNFEGKINEVEVETSLIATFTLDDNGLVESYSLVKNEEPT